MKSYGITIQMKPRQQYFHIALFIKYVVLTFESTSPLLHHFHMVLHVYKILLTFESVDEILWCDNSRGFETSSADTFTWYYLN